MEMVRFFLKLSAENIVKSQRIPEEVALGIDGDIDSGIPCSQKSLGSSAALSSTNQKNEK